MDITEKNNILKEIMEVLKNHELTVGEALEILELAKATVDSVGKGTKL